MSSIDEKKQQNELACFETAVSLAQQRGGKTLEILNYLNGTPVPREKEDKPDLVRVCTRGKKNPRNVLVGIEHFRVDQRSAQGKGKRISKGAEYTNHVWKAYEKGHRELEQIGEVSETSQASMLDQTVGLVQENIFRPYSSLIEDLSFQLSNHLSKVPTYRKNLQLASNGMPIELAFLIEVHAFFTPLFLNEGNNVSYNPSGQLVMFQDLVDELSKISNKTVDYIILLFNGSGFEQFTDVIAFRSGNIKNHLKQQGVLVYRYAGGDILGNTAFQDVNTHWEKNPDGNFNIVTNYSAVDRGKAMQSIYHVLRIAFYSKQKGTPFVATREVQSFLDAIWPYVDGFDKQNGSFFPHYKSNADTYKIRVRYDHALEQYKRMSNDDETTGAN